MVIAHRTHILRCAPEQLHLATSEEKQLIETPETQLLGTKDMLEGGTFRSAQYVDLLHESYRPVEKDVLQSLSPPVGPPGTPEADVPIMPEPTIDAVPETTCQPQLFQWKVSLMMFRLRNMMTQMYSKVSTTNVEAPDPAATSASSVAEPSASASSSGLHLPNVPAIDKSPAPSYGPLHRVPNKSGPLSLHPPMPPSHDDFVEIISEVLPKMLDHAVGSVKRSAPEADDEHQSKVPRRENERLYVDVDASEDGSLTLADAQELWNNLHEGISHEVLYAQYLQKRMQKGDSP